MANKINAVMYFGVQGCVDQSNYNNCVRIKCQQRTEIVRLITGYSNGSIVIIIIMLLDSRF